MWCPDHQPYLYLTRLRGPSGGNKLVCLSLYREGKATEDESLKSTSVRLQNFRSGVFFAKWCGWNATPNTGFNCHLHILVILLLGSSSLTHTGFIISSSKFLRVRMNHGALYHDQTSVPRMSHDSHPVILLNISDVRQVAVKVRRTIIHQWRAHCDYYARLCSRIKKFN